MTAMKRTLKPPVVQLVGEIDHPDFVDAVELLRSQSCAVVATSEPPELIVIAQSRPGVFSTRQVEALRRAAPLAGVVALLGSWCEGETRTGRPWPGVHRLYWYEFSTWWRRQRARHAAGLCPQWLLPANAAPRRSDCGSIGSDRGSRKLHKGVVVVRTPCRETAIALADALDLGCYATAWHAPGRSRPLIHGAMAGVWEGGQLDDAEAADLNAFCRELRGADAPVIALLDFPRRHNADRATDIGAAKVLGKPWSNAELIATVEMVVRRQQVGRAA